MTIPVLMAVAEDAGSLGMLDVTLSRRYGHDYLVVSEGSAAAALGRLRELRAAGSPVAMVLADSAMTAAAAAEFLAQARTIAPAAISRRRAGRGIPPRGQRAAGGMGARRRPRPARGADHRRGTVGARA